MTLDANQNTINTFAQTIDRTKASFKPFQKTFLNAKNGFNGVDGVVVGEKDFTSVTTITSCDGLTRVGASHLTSATYRHGVGNSL